MSAVPIRQSRPDDLPAIEQVYNEAFPDEDLLPLVQELLELQEGVLSLVAERDSKVVGHVSFTLCRVEGGENKVTLLAPLAVAPAHHKQGIGSALVKAGFDELVKAGMGYVLVLGDPGYYGRFGFKAEEQIKTPYALPVEWLGAWQSVCLNDADLSPEGKLIVPAPWRHAALWSD
jgi:putative acetyltransferase